MRQSYPVRPTVGRLRRWSISALVASILGWSIWLEAPAAATPAAEPARMISGSVSASAGAAGEASELRIYVSLPRQGANAATSKLIVNGLRAAVRQRQAMVAGRPLRLVHLDDAVGPRWRGDRVRRNAQRAVADDQAIAYVGELNSEASAVAEPILALAGMPMFAPVSTAPSLTDRLAAGSAKPVLFRSIPTDDDQADALVMYMSRAGVRRFALVEDGALYGQGLAATVAAVARRQGARLVAHGRTHRDGRGVRRLAARLARHSPQAVLFAGSLSSAAVGLFKALHARMPRALLFGGDALAHTSFARRLGPIQRRVRLTAPLARVNPRRARALGLAARPDPVTVFAYEGMAALLAAIERAGVADSEAAAYLLRRAVRNAVFDGTVNLRLIGPWSVEPDGDSSRRDFSAIRLRGGRLLDRGRIVARSQPRK